MPSALVNDVRNSPLMGLHRACGPGRVSGSRPAFDGAPRVSSRTFRARPGGDLRPGPLQRVLLRHDGRRSASARRAEVDRRLRHPGRPACPSTTTPPWALVHGCARTAEIDVTGCPSGCTSDHGFAQPLQVLLGGIDRVPVVPVFINCVAVPLRPGPPRPAARAGRSARARLGAWAAGLLFIGSGRPCRTTRRCLPWRARPRRVPPRSSSPRGRHLTPEQRAAPPSCASSQAGRGLRRRGLFDAAAQTRTGTGTCSPCSALRRPGADSMRGARTGSPSRPANFRPRDTDVDRGLCRAPAAARPVPGSPASFLRTPSRAWIAGFRRPPPGPAGLRLTGHDDLRGPGPERKGS